MLNLGVSRGTVDRRLAHVPYGQRSTTLLLRIRRFSCACSCFWHENISKYVTIAVDLTPVRNKTGPAHLLDVLEGRSKQAFKQWLQNRPQPWRDKIESIAMDGFSGFKSAAEEVLPKAQTVLDPFHVVRWASSMLDDCRRRAQQEILGRGGHKSDPLNKNRRVLLTRISHLTETNKKQLTRLFSDERHLEVDCSWSMYQRVVTA